MAEFPKFEISETNRGREQIIIEKKYKYNFSLVKKDKNKVFRCTEYKTKNKYKSTKKKFFYLWRKMAKWRNFGEMAKNGEMAKWRKN